MTVEHIDCCRKKDFDAVLSALIYVVSEYDLPAGPHRNVSSAVRVAKLTLKNLGFKMIGGNIKDRGEIS